MQEALSILYASAAILGSTHAILLVLQVFFASGTRVGNFLRAATTDVERVQAALPPPPAGPPAVTA